MNAIRLAKIEERLREAEAANGRPDSQPARDWSAELDRHKWAIESAVLREMGYNRLFIEETIKQAREAEESGVPRVQSSVESMRMAATHDRHVFDPNLTLCENLDAICPRRSALQKEIATDE